MGNYNFSQEKEPKSDLSMIENSFDTERQARGTGQAIKSARGMPWHWEPMKDVAIYDKPRLVESRHLTRGFPNGETRPVAIPVTVH